MRTPLLLLTLLLASLLQAQTTGKLLILSNVNAEVMVDSVAVGEAVASTPFVHETPVGDHVVQLVHGAGEASVMQSKTIVVADGQHSAMNFIFELKESSTGIIELGEPVKETEKE